MNSQYAEAHKRPTKKTVSFRLGDAAREYVETNHKFAKTEFYVAAIEAAIKKEIRSQK